MGRTSGKGESYHRTGQSMVLKTIVAVYSRLLYLQNNFPFLQLSLSIIELKPKYVCLGLQYFIQVYKFQNISICFQNVSCNMEEIRCYQDLDP